MLGLTWLLNGIGTKLQVHERNQNVLLIHGMDNNSFRTVAQKLKKDGYYIYELAYDAYGKSWMQIVDTLQKQIEKRIDTALVTHCVTHSVGSVVLRKFLEKGQFKYHGKTVFLSPVNGYSSIIDSAFSDNKFYTAKRSALYRTIVNKGEIAQMPLPDTFGVIAGNKSAFGFADEIAVGKNDGVVTVESTELEGMLDFTVYEDDHYLIRHNPKVAREISHFLEYGEFENSYRREFLFAFD